MLEKHQGNPTHDQVDRLAESACSADWAARYFAEHPEWQAQIRAASQQLHDVAMAADALYGFHIYADEPAEA